jgi:hypothetical protein
LVVVLGEAGLLALQGEVAPHAEVGGYVFHAVVGVEEGGEGVLEVLDWLEVFFALDVF